MFNARGRRRFSRTPRKFQRRVEVHGEPRHAFLPSELAPSQPSKEAMRPTTAVRIPRCALLDRDRGSRSKDVSRWPPQCQSTPLGRDGVQGSASRQAGRFRPRGFFDTFQKPPRVVDCRHCRKRCFARVCTALGKRLLGARFFFRAALLVRARFPRVPRRGRDVVPLFLQT